MVPEISTSQEQKSSLSSLWWLLTAGLFLFSCFGQYPGWILVGIVAGKIIYENLGKSPFTCWLFCALMFQLLQISMKVICGTFWYDLPVNPVREFPVSELFSSYAIACTGIALFAWIVRKVLGREDLSWKIDADVIADQTSLFFIYTGMATFWSIGVTMLFWFPGAFLGLGCEYFRYVLICILLIFFVRKSQFRLQTGFFLLIEFMLDIGYFSSFKTPLFLLFLVEMSLGIGHLQDVRKFLLITAPILLISLFTITVIWSGIKGNYRAYLTQGHTVQGSYVSQKEAVNYLRYCVSHYQWQENDVRAALKRLSYIDFFHAVRSYIPQTVPYRHGAECAEAITGLLPRFLFPGKKILDDSLDTTRLTGMEVAGREQGTSISVGYMAYLYADFGDMGVLAGMAVWGMTMGGLLKLLYRISTEHNFSCIIVIPLFFGFYKFETTLAKTIQGFIIFYIWAFFFEFYRQAINTRYERKE